VKSRKAHRAEAFMTEIEIRYSGPAAHVPCLRPTQMVPPEPVDQHPVQGRTVDPRYYYAVSTAQVP
jgi:hypothetical protein